MQSCCQYLAISARWTAIFSPSVNTSDRHKNSYRSNVTFPPTSLPRCAERLSAWVFVTSKPDRWCVVRIMPGSMSAEAGIQRGEPTMPAFDYTAYYQRVQDLKKLQIPATAVRWTERYEQPERSYEIVLYLGCNILRTPDITADVVAVFEALGLDFIAVAGVQFCCGITWDRFGDVAKGQNVSDNTVERLASYGSRVVVHWCPSCDVHFSDVVTGRDAKTLPFAVTNAPAFLRDLSQRGLIPWRNPIRGRIALHSHRGREGHETGQRRARADRENVSALLQQL